MSDHQTISGLAAPLPLGNCDTDQIMPKRFLHGIDKAGLAEGVLRDLRCEADGTPRPDFVLNEPRFADASIWVAGPNFGCGSSREHAVWGLAQFGVRAVISASFGEIFYNNAMNNRLLPVAIGDELAVEELLGAIVDSPEPVELTIDLTELQLHGPTGDLAFTMSKRHQDMFLEGLDLVGSTLRYRDEILAFAERHFTDEPWLRDLAWDAHARVHARVAG